MKKKLILLFLSSFFFSTNSEIRIVNENGFGSRALSLGNNYVAISNDISAIYWNPAALSYSLAREIHTTLDMSSVEGKYSFLGSDESSKMNQLKISNAGIMYSFPATQGGLTIALSYSNPVVFNDISEQSGSFIADNSDYSLYKNFRTSGGLKYLSGGFGLQVAPKIAIGAAVSFVYGKEDWESNTHLNISQNESYFDSTDSYKLKVKYYGYDIRLGGMYKSKLFSAGLRFTLPQIIKFKEDAEEVIQIQFYDDDPINAHFNDKYEDKMYSSYMGAAGVALTLPYFTVSTEIRGTLPFGYVFPSEEIPQGSQAERFKVGGGVGIEFPIPKMPILIRTGYSYDEIDLHRYVSKQEGDFSQSSWSDENVLIDRDKHQISGGIGFFSSSVSFDISYCFANWKQTNVIVLDDSKPIIENYKQTYNQHKVMASLAIRY